MLKLRLDRSKQILCEFILFFIFPSALIHKERNVERQNNFFVLSEEV